MSDLNAQPVERGWYNKPRRMLLSLTGARIVSQLIALGWFVALAHRLAPQNLAVVATGLAAFSLVGVLGNLGATWNVTRYVAADHSMAWSAYVSAVRIRVVGTLIFGLPTSLAVLGWIHSVSAGAVVLGVLCAFAAGLTDLGYEALRSCGRLKVEVATLIAERFLFVSLGAIALLSNAGPLWILVIYLVTNASTAAICGVLTYRLPNGRAHKVGPFWDAEARRIAAAFTLPVLGPRIIATLLVIIASPTELARFTVAYKPVEALTTLATGSALPLLSFLRTMWADNRSTEARAFVGELLAVGLLVLGPACVLFATGAKALIAVMAGAGNYPDSGAIMMIVAPLALITFWHAVMELMIIASERTYLILRVVFLSIAVDFAVGVPMIYRFGSVGASGTTLIEELLAFTVVGYVMRDVFRKVPLRWCGVGAILCLVEFGATETFDRVAEMIAITALLTCLGGLGAFRVVRTLTNMTAR